MKDFDNKQNAMDVLRYDLVKMRSDISSHYSKSYGNLKEQYAFAKKTLVFSISLEPHTDKSIIRETMNHYNELQNKIQEIKKNNTLDIKNKEANIIKLEFEYAEPVFYQSLRIFHNSPLVEKQVDAILNPRDKTIRTRIRNINSQNRLLNEANEKILEDINIEEISN